MKALGSFTYIIVGAGPAGCVLANRHSDDPRNTLALLEAGGWTLGSPFSNGLQQLRSQA